MFVFVHVNFFTNFFNKMPFPANFFTYHYPVSGIINGVTMFGITTQ